MISTMLVVLTLITNSSLAFFNSKDRLVTTGDNPSVTGFDYSCEARLVAKDKDFASGTVVPLQGLVFADAESNTVRNGVTESITVTPT